MVCLRSWARGERLRLQRTAPARRIWRMVRKRTPAPINSRRSITSSCSCSRIARSIICWDFCMRTPTMSHQPDSLRRSDRERVQPDSNGRKVPCLQDHSDVKNAYFMPGADPGEGYSATNNQLFGAAAAAGAARGDELRLCYRFCLYARVAIQGSELVRAARHRSRNIMGVFTPQMLPVLVGPGERVSRCATNGSLRPRPKPYPIVPLSARPLAGPHGRQHQNLSPARPFSGRCPRTISIGPSTATTSNR